MYTAPRIPQYVKLKYKSMDKFKYPSFETDFKKVSKRGVDNNILWY